MIDYDFDTFEDESSLHGDPEPEPTRRWKPREPLPESEVNCLITLDRKGEIIDFNPAAERAFACGRSQVVGQLMVDLVIPPAIRNRQWRGVFRYLMEDARELPGPPFEVIATRADGTEFPAEMAISRLEAESPHFYAVFLRDITGQKRNELKTEILVRYSKTPVHTN
jgi:PAS domain S-box-containing protein